jgi:hypothetical protein
MAARFVRFMSLGVPDAEPHVDDEENKLQHVDVELGVRRIGR